MSKSSLPLSSAIPPLRAADSRFDGLDSLDYVTTAVRDRALGETRGTLYVVVEDNDEDSNAHTNITATFTPPEAPLVAPNLCSLLL